jgi:hypothetical protein
LIGRRFIEDYYKRHYPFDEGRVLGLERYNLCPVKKHPVKVFVSTEKRYTVTLKEESR